MPLYIQDNKLLLNSGKLAASGDCCCTSTPHECLNCLIAATALNVTFNWFGDGSSSSGDPLFCKFRTSDCYRSALNSGFTLTAGTPIIVPGGVQLGFIITLGSSDDPCGDPGILIGDGYGQGFPPGLPCCDFYFEKTVVEITTFLSLSCNAGNFISGPISLGFTFKTVDKVLTDNHCVDTCLPGGHSILSAGGASLESNSWEKLCAGQSVILYGGSASGTGCGQDTPDGTATISLSF